MPLKQQDAPCWVITYPDGTPAAQWEEEHFTDEDEAAGTIGCEGITRAPGEGSPGPRQLSAPCLTIVCDGCGDPYTAEPGGRLIDHFTDAADARDHAGEVEFRDDGTTWCEDCHSGDEG